MEFRNNSLDAIRLFAAAQVCICHSLEYLHPEATTSFVYILLKAFPGVPIFFFLSGYLISKSFESSPDLAGFFANRSLRIFPALHACVLANIALVAATGYLSNESIFQIFLLYIAKTTMFQFYNPEFMRAFGDGVLNGSLWTICVELQLYLLVPIIYRIIRGRSNRTTLALLLGLIAVSILVNRVLYALEESHRDFLAWKLVRVSFAPWLYMFLTGVIAQKFFATLSPQLPRISGLSALAIYAVIATAATLNGFSFENDISPLLFLPLAALTFKLAYVHQGRVRACLRGNDISYGLYIWHMVFVNQLLHSGSPQGLETLLTSILATCATALVSWLLIERPCLRKKRHSLKRN